MSSKLQNRLTSLASRIAEEIKPIRNSLTSWATIDATVRYTGEVIETSEGEIESALFRGTTIYRFTSTELDEYGYCIEDAFYAEVELTTLIARRHD